MYNRDKNFKEEFFASNNIKINTYLDEFYRDNFH